MFGCKRRSILKQLWKQHQVLNPGSSSTGDARDRTVNTKAALKALAKRLKDRQMETLAQSIEAGCSGSPAGCVLVARCEVHLPGGQRVAPHVLACQLWRWHGLEDEKRLRRLPICSSSSSTSSITSSSSSQSQATNDALVCCNPYHWSNAIQDEPTKPIMASEEILLSHHHSTDGSFVSRRWMSPWCRLVYREYQHHIGGFYSIYSDWTRVFQDLFHGDGMCLSLIQKPTTNKPIDRTRSKIGKGILLSRENDSVWLYNCSEHPVFVCSPSFAPDVQRTWRFVVRRISPGCSLKVYDCAIVDRLTSRASVGDDRVSSGSLFASNGPVFYDSILVSFVKGWGKNYTRQNITSCPCWMEILLMRQ